MNTPATLEYFDEYRQKIAQLDELRSQEEKHRLEIEKLRKNHRKLQEELESMRKIITVMIDKGMDPVEAKLVTTDEDRKSSYWTDNMITNTGTITASGGLAAANSISITGASMYPTTLGNGIYTVSYGATGATGAMGANGSYASMAAQQYAGLNVLPT
jgi:acetyl-CoA carboxylase carboxyltransferase component